MSGWPSDEVLAVLRLVHCQWNKSRMKRSLNFRLKIAQKRSVLSFHVLVATCSCVVVAIIMSLSRFLYVEEVPFCADVLM